MAHVQCNTHRLHDLQMGATKHPSPRIHTWPPTWAPLEQPAKEHFPRLRPVALSHSCIHDPPHGRPSELPSTFHASTDPVRWTTLGADMYDAADEASLGINSVSEKKRRSLLFFSPCFGSSAWSVSSLGGPQVQQLGSECCTVSLQVDLELLLVSTPWLNLSLAP